jgi:uncharacterized membrane protein
MGRTPFFSVQFTLVIIATLLVMHHSLTYGAVMLILPVAAVFSEKLASAWTEWSVLLIAVLPTLAFTLLQIWSASLAKRLVTFGLLSCFASLLWTAWRQRQTHSIRESLPLSDSPSFNVQ